MTFSAATPARAQDITTGLVGHWKLDEAGAPFTDEVSGNNASVSLGTPVSEQGRIGNALGFNGNSGVSTSSSASYGNLRGFTISTWIKPGGLGSSSGIVEIPGIAKLMAAWNSDHFQFLATAWDTQQGDWRFNNLLKVDQWQHLAVTYNYNDPVGTKPVLYLNGRAYDNPGVAFAPSGSVSAPAPTDLKLSNGNPFNGAIDDVRIYDRALTAQDVAALYAAWPGHLRYNADARVPEYFNGSEWVAAAPKPYVPNAVRFDSATYLQKGGFPNSKSFTASFWLRKNKPGYDRPFWETQSNGINAASNSSNNIYIRIRDASNATALSVTAPNNVLGDSNWHHLLISADVAGADAAKVHMYLDDVDVGTVTTIVDQELKFTENWEIGDNVSPSWEGDMTDVWIDTGTYIDLSVEANRRKFITASGNPVNLGTDGSRPTGSAPDIFLSGDTDDWHVNKGAGGGFTENGALTDAPTAPGGPYSHVPTNGLVGWWRLDERSGSDVIDYASGNNGTYFHQGGSVAAVQSRSGVHGGALSFFSHKVDFGANPDLDFSGTNAFTFSAWVRPEENHGVRILHRGAGGGVNFSYQFGRYEINPGRWEVKINDGASQLWALAPINSVKLGQWTLLTATWNGSDLILYGNDLQIASNSSPGFVLWDPPTAVYRETSIGGDGRDHSYYFGGLIDNVMVWNRALNASEVAALYSAGVCDNPLRTNGQIVYSGDFNVLQYCDAVRPGDGWQAMGPPGTGGSGCSNPSGVRASAFYSADYRVLQYCDGSTWRALGKIGDPCADSPSPGNVCADGSVYAGLSPDGNVPMYTTPADAGLYPWNNGNSSGYVTTNQASNITGRANTENLIAIDSDSGTGGSQPHQAAQYCADLSAHGHTDWYLPARNELYVLYTNRATIGGFDTSGSFPAAYYWSSSEDANSYARDVYFPAGSQGYSWKQHGLSVRCVRK